LRKSKFANCPVNANESVALALKLIPGPVPIITSNAYASGIAATLPTKKVLVPTPSA